MIDYRELCESVIRKPPFGRAITTNAIGNLAQMEAIAYSESKNKEVYFADNEKWHTLWLEMQLALYRYPSYMIGNKQFVTLMSPLKHEIIGRTQ